MSHHIYTRITATSKMLMLRYENAIAYSLVYNYAYLEFRLDNLDDNCDKLDR